MGSSSREPDRRHLPPVCLTLGMKLERAGRGAAVFSMPVGKRFFNPMGTVHGGIITDLSDASMGYAVMTTLGAGETFTTLELKINFIRPAFEGKLTCRAKVQHRGRTIVLVEAVVTNSEDKVVARGVATQMVIKNGEPARQTGARSGPLLQRARRSVAVRSLPGREGYRAVVSKSFQGERVRYLNRFNESIYWVPSHGTPVIKK